MERPQPVEQNPQVTVVVRSEVRPWRYPPRMDFQYGEWLRSDLEIGNLDPQRDWGHSKDYVRAMHLMLQLEKPDDFVEEALAVFGATVVSANDVASAFG